MGFNGKLRKEKVCGIYSLIGPSGKMYIGQSIDINKRLNTYKNLDCKSQPKLYCYLLKYGFDLMETRVEVICEKSELNYHEKLLIFAYQPELNLTDGGEGGPSGEKNHNWKGGIKSQPDYMKNYNVKNREKHSINNKKYRLENLESIKLCQKEWREKNKDEQVTKHKEYYYENLENILLKKKEYHLKNKERINKKNKEYQLKNKEALKIKAKDRRRRKRLEQFNSGVINNVNSN